MTRMDNVDGLGLQALFELATFMNRGALKGVSV